jgi:predicted ATPase
VIESAAKFADRVLGECRRLRILATSREPLGITGEALWLVEPLAVPTDASPAQIASSPAVRLLQDRAGAVRKDLGVDDHTLSTMARICRALDGMPLAIELAAARLRTMTIDQLANRLDDRFRLLTSGSRTALPRHRTLRTVVDWSWELLTDAERMVLRRLSVFSGSASLEAAERVCAGDGVEQEEALELLTALTEKSLLLTEGNGAPRYRMLGTIKEYAADRLTEAGESDLARQAHLAYFTKLTETAEPHLRRAEQLAWLATLKAEHDNISAAMRGAITAGDAQAAMRLAAAAGWYWWLGGRRSEGIELMIAATNIPGEVTDDVRAMTYALVVLFVTSGRGDEHQARNGSTRRIGSVSTVTTATRCWDWLPRWNACCRRRTPRCPRSSRCWTAKTPGYAPWPGCTSARCGSCSAKARRTRRPIWRWRSRSSGRSANDSGFP